MDRLWQRLSETFGAAFTTAYGHRPNQAWCDALSGLTVGEIKRGLDGLFTWTDAFAPNALQFRDLCRPRTHAAHEAYVPLPAPSGDFEARQRIALDTIRALREGILRPDTEDRRGLSAETRALLPALDGDAGALALATDIATRQSGCTCAIVDRGVDRSCPACQRLFRPATIEKTPVML